MPSRQGHHAALLPHHGEIPTVRDPLNNSAPSSIGCNRHPHPSFTPVTAQLRTPFTAAALPIPATSACLSALSKGAHTPVEHLTPSSHLLPSSLVPVPSWLGTEVPLPVCHFLAVVQALVRSAPVASCCTLRVATLTASRRGPEWPLG
jgi:hypothetical protein